MNWSSSGTALVRLAPGLWVNLEDVSAIQDRKTGTKSHTNIILRNGVTVALTNSTSEDVVKHLMEAHRKMGKA